MERAKPKQECKPKSKHEAYKTAFIARSNYGKSFLAADYILEQFKNKTLEPKRLIVFSKTFKSDPSQRKFIDAAKKIYPQFEDKNCFEGINTELIDKIYEGCKKIKEDGRAVPHFCIYFDDMVSEKLLAGKTNFVATFCLMRHFGVSAIILLQSWRSVFNSVLRNQLTQIFIGALSSASAIDDLLSEVNGGLGHSKKESFKIIYDFYHEALQHNDNHGFLFVDLTRCPWNGEKFRIGLDGPFLDTPDKRPQKP